MSTRRWVMITGEYPPNPGGVSDYTRLVARGLAQAGDDVHVITPRGTQTPCVDPGVSVHLLPNHFGLRALAEADRVLARLPRPYQVLVQYVPHAFGWKGMNLPFCHWVRRRREPVWTMFHEVAFPWERSQPWRHQFLGMTTRMMARWLVLANERTFVSIPAWDSLLHELAPGAHRTTWLPIPSNLPTEADASDVNATREKLASSGRTLLVGHFGTYAPHLTRILGPLAGRLLSRCETTAIVLMGRNSRAFAEELVREFPTHGDRIIGVGELEPEPLTQHIAACDCLVQPFPDGISTRRTSAMAGLALGVPTVTNVGPLTEPIWRTSEAVSLVGNQNVDEFLPEIDSLLADSRRRTVIGQNAASLYREHFSLDRTVSVLRACAQESAVDEECSSTRKPLSERTASAMYEGKNTKMFPDQLVESSGRRF